MPINFSPPSTNEPNFHKSRRIVTRSGEILRGKFGSCRYEKQINWEAGTEQDTVTLMEFSSVILNVTSQPFKSVFELDGEKTSRTPDFLVETELEQILVECKPAEALKDPSVRLHLDQAKIHFENLGYRYYIATDLEIRSGSALKNANFLLPYRMRPMQSERERSRLLNQLIALRTVENLTIGSATAIIGDATDVRALMASGYLHFNFHLPICSQTILTFHPLSEKYDAASFLFN